MAQTLRTVLTIDMRGFRQGLKRAQVNVKAFGRDIARPIGAAARQIARLALVAVALGAAFAAMGIKAARELGGMKLRMKAMSSSAADFEKSWGDAFTLFLRTPLELGDTVEATTLLKAFGVQGMESLKAVASTAVMMGREIGDVVAAIGGMNAKQLRRLGIESSAVGGKFAFQFRDKAGNSMKLFANNIQDARKQVLKIMDIKFGGGLEIASKTFGGAMSTLRGVKTAVLADLFKPLTSRLAPQIVRINEALIKMMESGKFVRFGNKIRDVAIGFFSYARQMAKAVREFAKSGGENLRTFALVFGLVAAAFKLGLVVPMIKASAMLATGMIAAFKSILFWKIALVAGLASMTRILAATFGQMSGSGDSFRKAFGDQWTKFGEDVKSALAAGVDAIIPGDVREFMKDIKGADFKLPDWPDTPEFNFNGDGIADGVEDGMLRSADKTWGRVFGGGTNMNERKAASERSKQLTEAQRQTRTLTSIHKELRDRHALAW